MGTAIPSERCNKCGVSTNEALRHCQSCGFDLGPPNVRACRTSSETKALQDRYEEQRRRSETSGCLAELEAFVKAIAERSSVVIAMPGPVALQLVSDERNLYANYEQLVGGGLRIPAEFENDSHRLAVVGSLFGSYGERLKYGILSLKEKGLSTYGGVFCRLKPIAIDERASFLEWNSFRFEKEFKPRSSDRFPPGHRADWAGRGVLAAVKLGSRIRSGQSEKDWEQMLIVTDGVNRSLDEFIEAHIYDGFNVFSIESMSATDNLPKGQRSEVRAAIRKFEKMRTLS